MDPIQGPGEVGKFGAPVFCHIFFIPFCQFFSSCFFYFSFVCQFFFSPCQFLLLLLLFFCCNFKANQAQPGLTRGACHQCHIPRFPNISPYFSQLPEGLCCPSQVSEPVSEPCHFSIFTQISPYFSIPRGPMLALWCERSRE